jgi:hypothetical protein
MPESLCDTCDWVRIIQTPRGSRLLLCELSSTDSAMPKYPRQPVVRCASYQSKRDAAELPPKKDGRPA